MKPPISYNGTENLIQNFCVTFRHNFYHKYSFITNSFVIKGANVTEENALKVAGVLFPNYTDIEIVSIKNDELTLTPSEYHFMQGVLKDKLVVSKTDPHAPLNYKEYLVTLIKKMEARMGQFPVYHT